VWADVPLEGDSFTTPNFDDWVGWGITLTEDWFRGKSSAPSYSPNMDLLVLSPEGQLAAHSLVWLYPHNQTAVNTQANELFNLFCTEVWFR
jgi:hypothetical protein